MNDTLVSLQDTLVREHKRMRASLPTLPDADARQAVLREMAEITHRVQIVGGLLFARQSAQLDDAAAGVKSAAANLRKAVEQIKKVQEFLAAATDFLKVVDEAIDLAKTLVV